MLALLLSWAALWEYRDDDDDEIGRNGSRSRR